jgi:non-specific serine/threonine protein kinase/serine/threonine-protein kinase
VSREQHLRELLETVLDLPTGERRAKLEDLTADATLVDEVLTLVDGEARLGDFLATPAVGALGADSPGEPEADAGDGATPGAEAAASSGGSRGRGGGGAPLDPAGPPPPEIPGFVVERLLGEGGMGRVYLARQTAPVVRLVAIKMIHAHLEDPRARLRFASEQQALARLNHPAVAQLYDAGTTADGRPYVVMEHVDGTPLTEYCDRERLSIEERLRLFVAVCRGVEHAHRRQLLHRDLKPSNLLVTTADGAPAPKIIDFGIARALDAPLDDAAPPTGLRVLGTPHYMSPEALQATEEPRDLDTRTDVYSLGVVLFELLTGSRPFAPSTGDVVTLMRRISEDEPPRPSSRLRSSDEITRSRIAGARSGESRQLVRRLAGDLDWIVLRALARDREKRYGSAAALADDIERSLRHEPVVARPPSLADRLLKLARRHRLAAVLAAVTLTAVAGAAVVSSLALVRATRAEREAVAEAAATRELLDFVVGLFEAARPEATKGEDVSPHELVALGAARLAEQEDLAPLQRARLLHTLADVQLRLGDYESGRQLAAEALALREENLEEAHPDVLRSLDLLSTLDRRAGRLEEAEPLVERMVELAQADPEHPAVLADALNTLANLRWRQDRLEEAEALHRRTLKLRRAAYAAGDATLGDVGSSLNNLGVLLWSQERFEEAEPFLREAADAFEAASGADSPRVAAALGNLGIVLSKLGRYDEEEPLQLRALAIRQKVLGPEHPDVSISWHNLGVLYSRTGRLAQAEDAYRRALSIRRTSLGEDHPETLKTRRNLALVLEREGRTEEAQELRRAGESQ